MEKRKWLWKKKSSEKSSCETESSGSISSHSERYSDEQDALKGSPDTQSPEVSSNSVPRSEVVDESSLKIEDVNDSVKILTERLSAALVNVSAKEDLVKQHSKVAEEAVAGWEKAENEVAALKQQLEAVSQQKSALEDRVSHLDGALKECVRQLRQARDDHEQKLQETVSLKTLEWESTKCILERKLLELQHKADSSPRIDPEIYQKLEFLEKENSALRLEIHDQMEELEVRTIERDLSTQVAESASKQHLESIKKLAKLEAECRRLKSIASKSSLVNEHKSTAASSTYVESFTDSHSDSGERNLLDSSASPALVVNKSLPISLVNINMMDDFLEMEQIAAMQPTTDSKSISPESESKSRESVLRAELESMIRRTAELEQRLVTLETEKARLEACESQNEANVLREELELRTQLSIKLEERLREVEQEKAEFENESGMVESAFRTELEGTNHRMVELEEMLEKLEKEKAELENESKSVESVLRSELELMIHRTAELEEKLDKLEAEKTKLETESKNGESSLKTELEAMKNWTSGLEEKLEKLEAERDELEKKLENLETEKSELEDKLEKLEIEKSELEAKESKRGETVLRAELALIHQTAESDEKLEKMKSEKAEAASALTKSREFAEALQLQLMETELKLEAVHKEFTSVKESKETIESQLVSFEAEARTMSAKVSLLEEAVQREKGLSDEIAAKCRELEYELSAEKEEVNLCRVETSIPEKRIKQEDLTVVAGKLAECQNTIASLGNQLKSLATLEDFLIGAANIPELSSSGGKLNPSTGEHWKLHSNQTFSPKREFGSLKTGDQNSPIHSLTKNQENPSPLLSSSSSSSTSAMVIPSNAVSEKNMNGFAKFFSRTKSGIRLEI